ncbi:hypothetical protein ACS126_03515 [Sphingobacterium lactis]|uniref:hypothetical protein n=1 Tax=Sphingobacterium lactis TaxID=797291 RepID=UPI003EC5247F
MTSNKEELDWQDEKVRAIVDFIDDFIGYGSFAGDFSTDGLLEFSKEDQCFYGTDTYVESESETGQCEIKIALPTDIWFDQVRLFICDNRWDPLQVAVELIVNNGPITDKHIEIQDKATEHFTAEVEVFMQEHHQMTGIWYNEIIPSTLFTMKGETLEHTVDEISYTCDTVDERDVLISLN